uniref:F-box domain-containing protein n=1 Tax=Caenorhabditis tropicalis TaxID=1561998 RepID=A0A1I7UK26_9PELO
MSSPSFRLFHLPQVVLRELLNLLDLNELFIFSLCSRRANRYVKLYYNRFLKWKMFITGFSRQPVIQVEKKSRNQTIVAIKENIELPSVEKVTIGRHIVSFVKTPENCELYWDDRRIGFKTVVDYICELFSPLPNHLCVGPDFIWMLEMFNNLSQHIVVTPVLTAAPCLEFFQLNEEECLEVLTTKIKSPTFDWGGSFPENFSYAGSFGVHDRFTIDEGLWVTVDNLVSMGETCSEVSIYKSKLSSGDLNTFLKMWLNQKANALRLLVIKCENINRDVIFDGLENEMITVEGTMVYENKKLSAMFESMGTPLEFPPGLKVLRRNDGMIAAAALHSFGLCIGIWTDIGSIRENEPATWKLLPINNPLNL